MQPRTHRAQWQAVHTVRIVKVCRGCAIPSPSAHTCRSAPPAWPLRVQRSSQLDAARLDNELLAMLQEQMNAIFARFRPVSAG
jgi:hypothetical protein